MYQKATVIGVVICILGIVPLMIAAGMEAGDYVYVLCTCILLAFIACGTYLFVRTGMIWESFNKLLQEGDYTEAKKEKSETERLFSGGYWCIITAIYLGISFYTARWDITWVIWILAGGIFAACKGILGTVKSSRKSE